MQTDTWNKVKKAEQETAENACVYVDSDGGEFGGVSMVLCQASQFFPLPLWNLFRFMI